MQIPHTVTEFLAGGSLQSQLDKDETGEYTWQGLGHSIALDVVKGLCFLHTLTKYPAHRVFAANGKARGRRPVISC